MIADSMCLRPLLLASLMLAALVACRDPDAPRPVNVLPTASPGAGTRPLSSREAPGTDVRPVAPTPPAAPALPTAGPDPAEPGISDLARLARYVYREMRTGQDVCAFSNPLRDPISFAFHVEVQAGRMTKAHLAWAGVRHAEDTHRLEPPPPELAAYAECLGPRLQAIVMDPAPADGAYEPEYSYPGLPGGR